VDLSPNNVDTTHRKFGVEQEQFVFHADGTPPSHEETDQLWAQLQQRGYEILYSDAHGRVLSVGRNLSEGPIVVSNDACTNIVEVALPPFRSLARFREVSCQTWNDIEEELKHLGLRIRRGGALPDGLDNVQWRPKATDPDGERLFRFVHRTPLNDPLFCSNLLACITATHVSLGVPDTEAVRLLPSYYAFEFLVPLWFSTSPRFLSVEGHCVRPLTWMANFPQSYPLIGILDPIPRDMTEYAALRAQCPSRDYSFVAIRNEERLEFRSADSQESITTMEQLIRFRLAVDLATQNGVIGNWNPRTMFQNACLGKPIEILSEAVDSIKPYFDQCGVAMENSITSPSVP
jgi:hypothetical protein